MHGCLRSFGNIFVVNEYRIAGPGSNGSYYRWPRVVLFGFVFQRSICSKAAMGLGFALGVIRTQ